jgi:hypothetical protein
VKAEPLDFVAVCLAFRRAEALALVLTLLAALQQLLYVAAQVDFESSS